MWHILLRFIRLTLVCMLSVCLARAAYPVSYTHLMDLAESLGFAATAAHVGERAQVIVDGIEEDVYKRQEEGHAHHGRRDR